jgi:hypothetical protein
MNGLGKTAQRTGSYMNAGANARSIYEALQSANGTSIFEMLREAHGGRSIYEDLRVASSPSAKDGKANSLLQRDWKK